MVGLRLAAATWFLVAAHGVWGVEGLSPVGAFSDDGLVSRSVGVDLFRGMSMPTPRHEPSGVVDQEAKLTSTIS